jgi:hypothetical protein
MSKIDRIQVEEALEKLSQMHKKPVRSDICNKTDEAFRADVWA